MFTRPYLTALACLGISVGLFVTDGLSANSPGGPATPVAPQRPDVNPPQPGMTDRLNNWAADLSLPAGIHATQTNSDKSIERAFKSVAEDALSKTGMDNIVGQLVDQDRVRIQKSLSSGTMNNINDSKNTRLNKVIDSLETAWKAKYNGAFDLDSAKVYTADFIRIQTGEVNDPIALVGQWPVNPQPGATAGKLTPADANQAQNSIAGGDVNLEKGRSVAVARLMKSGISSLSGQSSQRTLITPVVFDTPSAPGATPVIGGVAGMTTLNASLIKEVGGWKFDVPNTLTATKLYDNLCQSLEYMDQHRSEWAADADSAGRQFTFVVAAALYDAAPATMRPADHVDAMPK